MSVYFMQHGKCVNKEENPKRPLSEMGKEETEKIVKFLESDNLKIKRICHSGKLRASETADIVLKFLPDVKVSIIENMNPNDSVIEFCKSIEDETLYVGHLPHLNRVISYLVTNKENGDVTVVKNSSIVCLEAKDKHFCLKWYLLPDLC